MSEPVDEPASPSEEERAQAYLESQRRRARARLALLRTLSGSRSARRQLSANFGPVMRRPEERW